VTSTKLLYEYDPVGDSWIPRATYPGYWCRFKVALESGGMAYLGFGERISDLLHRYDPQTDTWQRIPVPNAYFHTCLLNFSLNGKVYLCENGTRFWSYDPMLEP
jgi:N-acetylneuraminic acid mutarotase